MLANDELMCSTESLCFVADLQLCIKFYITTNIHCFVKVRTIYNTFYAETMQLQKNTTTNFMSKVKIRNQGDIPNQPRN